MARRGKYNNSSILIFLSILILSFCVYLYVTYDENQIKNVGIPMSDNALEGIKVTYLDVGQADSILIQVDDKNMLIDAGNNNDGEKIVNYLKKQNISNFKYVFGTHAHEDHIGGMDDIINNFSIENFYMPNVMTTTKTFEDVLDALLNKGVTFKTPNIGDLYDLNDVKIEVLYTGTNAKDLNNTSIVLKLIYKDITFLFMGDAENSVEKELLNKNIKADVLKLGHHGSDTSTGDEFLNKIKPSYAIISVGKDNKYNHPSGIILDRLNNKGIKIYRTDKLGTIILTSDGESIHIDSVMTDTDGG